MNGVNLCTFVGVVAGRPEMRSTTNGTPVLAFSLAVNDEWVDSQRQRKSRCEWVQIALFGKAALNLSRVLADGDMVAVVGRLRTETFEHRGEKRYATKIVAERLQVLTPKGEAPPPPVGAGPQGVLEALERAGASEFSGESVDEEVPV